MSDYRSLCGNPVRRSRRSRTNAGCRSLLSKGASRANIKSRRRYADKDIKYHWQSLRDIDSDFAGFPQGYSKEDLYEELIATNKERINNLVAEGRRTNIQLSLLSGVSVLLMVVLSGVFIIDSRYPNMGLIRPETNHLLTIAGGVMLVFALFACYLIYISIKDWKRLK